MRSERRAKPGEERAPDDESSNRGLRTHEPRQLETHAAFEQDDRNCEFNNVEQAIAKGRWFNPPQAVGSEPNAQTE